MLLIIERKIDPNHIKRQANHTRTSRWIRCARLRRQTHVSRGRAGAPTMRRPRTKPIRPGAAAFNVQSDAQKHEPPAASQVS